MNASPEPKAKPKKPIGPLIALGVLLVAGASLYGMGRFKGNPGGACAAAGPLLAKLEPLAKGEIAALQVPKAPKLIAGLKFNRPDSTPAAISEFSGRTVLLNLWATWCVPCKAEMPALDKLQAELGAKDFEVVAVNIDTRNTDKARDWLKEAGISRLTHYTDHSAAIFQDLKQMGRALGMPTTLLIGKDGCELGYLAGPAEWASPDAIAFIKAALGR